jgi:hypothetical protein
MRDAGFLFAETRSYVFEPEANVIGVLSEGRNRTAGGFTRTMAPPAPYTPSFARMFAGNQFALKALQGVDGRRRGVLVVDIGAYTTDIAYVVFDSSLDADPHAFELRQESRAIGIRDLDADVVEHLPQHVRAAVESADTAGWETMKRQLYAQQPSKVRSRSGEWLPVSQAEAAKIMPHAASRFAQPILAFCSEFRKTCDYVHAIAFSGGGYSIRLLQGELGTLDSTPDVVVLALSQRMVRGATALGGASLMFDA